MNALDFAIAVLSVPILLTFAAIVVIRVADWQDRRQERQDRGHP